MMAGSLDVTTILRSFVTTGEDKKCIIKNTNLVQNQQIINNNLSNALL